MTDAELQTDTDFRVYYSSECQLSFTVSEWEDTPHSQEQAEGNASSMTQSEDFSVFPLSFNTSIYFKRLQKMIMMAPS